MQLFELCVTIHTNNYSYCIIIHIIQLFQLCVTIHTNNYSYCIIIHIMKLFELCVIIELMQLFELCVTIHIMLIIDIVCVYFQSVEHYVISNQHILLILMMIWSGYL